MIDLYEIGRKKYDWWLDWRGQYAAVVAGGPSVRNQDLSILKDRMHVSVVNESHRLCPWAEILYSCDGSWWRLKQIEIEKFKGLKVGFETSGISNVKNITIKKISADNWNNDLLLTEPGLVGSGGNSGFQLMNLITQMGVSGIAMIGIDCNLSGGVHWHGRHPDQLRNPDEAVIKSWKKNLDAVALEFKKIKVDVVNCSPVSMLENYPKMTVNQMLERWGL